MSLKVWLPLDGDLRNLGCSDVEVTNNGATIDNAGKIGKCYSFDGTNDYIVGTYTPTTNISFCCWVYFPAIPNGKHIFDGRNTTGNSGYQPMYITASGIQIGGSGSGYPILSYTWAANTWYHICVTHDAQKGSLYVNGNFISSSTTAKGFNAPECNFTLGSRCNQSNYSNIKLNDVRIYDHCLSAAEVKEIAQGLVLHYKLDNGSQEIITNIPSTNVYNYPTFNTSATGGGWFHWGPSGHSGNYGQNTDKKYIYNKNHTYSHWITEDAETKKYYLLYQSPAFEGGYRSLQAIIKEENSLPITESICYPTWNARNGGVPNDKWTSIKSLGNGFYYCCCEGISQDGSNDLAGINVMPGYKIYVSECYLEDNTETCSPIFTYSSNIIQDSSGYNHNGEIINELHISNDTARYNNSTLFDGVDDCIIVPYNEVCPENIFTINLWFKKEALGSKNYETLFGGPGGFEMDTRAGSATSLSLYMASTRSGNRATGITMNKWHMITMTRDGTTEKYYVDGEFKSEIEAKSMPNGVYRIGAWASNMGQNYYGLINDFRIYCTPLLDTDIKLLYNIGSRIDNLGGVHTFEFEENKSNIFRSELIMPVAKAGRTARIGEIVEHNGYYAMNIAPEPFYKNISDSVSGFLQGYFYTNTSYIFDLWIDVDSVIYNGSNVAGGLSIIFTDGSSDNSFVFTGGNKGWQHKKIITPSNKTIDRLSVWYYTSTDVFYRLDSYICPISSTKIIKQGILDITNITENSEIASIYKGGSIYSSEFIEI